MSEHKDLNMILWSLWWHRNCIPCYWMYLQKFTYHFYCGCRVFNMLQLKNISNAFLWVLILGKLS